MRIESTRPGVLRVTLHVYELSALIASERRVSAFLPPPYSSALSVEPMNAATSSCIALSDSWCA